MKMGSAVIEGRKYEFGFWDVDTSTEYLTKLAKLLAEPFGAMVGGTKAGGVSSLMDADVSSLNMEALTKAFQGLATRLNEEEVKDILRQCTKSVLCDGKPIEYDSHFLGKVGLLFRVAIANLKHQYSDFLPASLGVAK